MNFYIVTCTDLNTNDCVSHIFFSRADAAALKALWVADGMSEVKLWELAATEDTNP